ncbi:MAG: hypothetical protein E7341_04975 [Clostridiales bacterium]|nr:hypothetical protein [Clostridiales bacterium]
MLNLQSLLSAFNIQTFVVITTILVVVLLLTAIFFIWWVETKKKPMKEFWKIVGQKFYNFFEAIYDLFYSNGEVKTVYSDKSLNYSGTEFLPIPTKAPTNQYSYEFIGWDKNGVDENGNTVVRAIYLQKVTKCYVNVYDDDKMTLLGSYEVEYGAGLALNELKPTKPESKEFAYEFVGWDKNTDAFYKNENVYAVYNAVPKKYKYEFVEDDGKTVVSQGFAIYGTPITAPTAPKKETEDSSNSVYEFAGWKGYEDNMLLTRDVTFVATYKLTPVGGTGSSSIIKTDKEGDVVKIVEETALPPQEHSEHAEIQRARVVNTMRFDTPNDTVNQKVTEVKMGGQAGVIRKKNGAFVQMNNASDVERFQKINTGEQVVKHDDEVHQKIQLMTVKKTADVKKKESEVITIKPKAPKKEKEKEDYFGNMMVNKIKINKNN